MPFVNREIGFGEFMEQLHQRIQKLDNSDALEFFERFLQKQLIEAVKRRANPEWDGQTLVAGDFDIFYPMAANILFYAATEGASEQYPDTYKDAAAVSAAICEYINELFQCSGDDVFDFLEIKSYSQMMAETGLVKIKDGMVSLTPAGEAAAQKVEQEIAHTVAALRKAQQN